MLLLQTEIDVVPIVDAFTGRRWYALLGAVIAVLIQLLKRFGPALWTHVPVGWRWTLPVAMGFLGGLAVALAQQHPILQALAEAVNAGIAGGLSAMGLNAALTESPLPWGGGRGGREPEPPLMSEPPGPA